jgi:hypothetical protein
MATEISQSLVNALTSYFVRADRPLTSLGNAHAAFASIPMLRAFWTMGSVDSYWYVYDASMQGRALSHNGGVSFSSYLLMPFVEFNGLNGYLSRAHEAGLDLLGNETHVSAAQHGLTVGGWFWFDRLTNNEGLITKGQSGVSTDCNYKLTFRGDVAGDYARFSVFDTAHNSYEAISSVSCVTGQWHFIVGRFNAQDGATAGQVHVWVNGVKNTAAADITVLDTSTKELNIGSIGGANSLLDGRASFCFLSAKALSDGIIQSLYHVSRYGYAVR